MDGLNQADPFRPIGQYMPASSDSREAFLFEAHWDQEAWIQVVLAFLEAFAPADPVALLLVWDASDSDALPTEAAQARVVEVIQHLGLASFPDIILEDQPSAWFPLLRSFRRFQWVVPGLSLEGLQGLRFSGVLADLLPAKPGPSVSVLLPTRNRPAMLARALASLEAQTCRSWEAVVVNDGGEDVAGVLEPFRQRGLEIRLLVHPRALGPAAARNTALTEARGRWIAYLDDDDCFRSDHLARLIEAAESQGADVAYSDAERVSEDATGTVLSRADAPSRPFEPEALLAGALAPLGAMLHTRDVGLAVGGHDPSLPLLEDWAFQLRLAPRGTFLHVPGATLTTFWRAGAGNLSRLREGLQPLCRHKIEQTIRPSGPAGPGASAGR